MNDKLSYLHSQGSSSMKEGGGGGQVSERGWGQLLTDENERREDRYMLDSNNIYTIKTEESESNELNQVVQASQTLRKLSKLNQKHSIVEEENNSEDLNDSQVIRLDSDDTPAQKFKKVQVKSMKVIDGKEENPNQKDEDIDQNSYQPSDNYEFHSNLASLERIEMDQKQQQQQQKNKKMSTPFSDDQGINIEMVQIGLYSNKTIKGTGGATTQSRNQQSNQINSSSMRQPNRSLTAIESHSPNKLIKIDNTPNSNKKIRQIKTAVEDDNKKILSFGNKMNTSIIDMKQNDNESNDVVNKLKTKMSMRRGGSAVENEGNGQMTKAQKRKTFLNLRGGTAKIKNFFSRTFTDQGPGVLGLLLNAWRFISSLKRVSTVWRPNIVTTKQIELIDDSTHFDLDQNPNRKRRKLFGTSFTLSKDAIQRQSTSIQGRKKQVQESQLMKWMLKTLKYVPIIDPQSQILYVWDTIHSMFIILNLLIQPIEFVTYTHMETQYDSYIWKIFPYICFSIFIAHILLNFNIGFYQRGICIMDRKQVMTDYFKQGFIWDLLALLPIIDSIAQFESAWRIVNVFIVCKYITLRSILGKYLELFQLQNQVFIPTFIKLLKVGFLVLFQAHLFACLFLGLANLEKSYNLTDVTWIEHYSQQQQSYKGEHNRLTNETVFSQYIYAFYWSVTTMTTTGYGDISASNNYEATFTAFSMIIAGGVFAYSFNSIGFIVSDLNKRNSEFQKDMSLISKYLKNINIKRSLQIEVTKYIEYKYRAETELSTKEEKEVLEKLGPNIRDKITMSANIQLIKQVPFLINNFSRRFLRRLALHMQKETYLNNEIIFEENDFYTTHHPNIYGQQLYTQQQNYPIQQMYQQQYQLQNNQPIFVNNPTFQNLQQNMVYPQQQNNQYLHPQQLNIGGSQSIQLPPAMPQYYQQQHQVGININQGGSGSAAQNNTAQFNSPQVNSFQSLSTNVNGLQYPSHTRKLSGSQMQPNLVSNFLNQNNINLNNVQSPHQMNINGTPHQQRNSAIHNLPMNNQNNQQSQQCTLNTLNVFSGNDHSTNTNQLNLNNMLQAQQQNMITQNHSDEYFYVQTLQQSQSDITFYVVERGAIQLFTRCFKYITEDETTKPIKELKKGDLFGELSFFTEKPRCASAKSIGPSSVLSIKKKDFIKLLKEYPSDYEIYCQIHDEIVNNNNLDSLQIRCYSCDRTGHTTNLCNKIHFQPDKEKVILCHNYKECKQIDRNKDVWRRISKYKCLSYTKELIFAQKRIESTLYNQSQLSNQVNQQQQQQQNFTTYFNHTQSNTPPQPSPFNPASTASNIRSGQKKLTLRQLQTMQTQIVDPETFIPPSPLRFPQQNNAFAFNFQHINGNFGQANNTLQTQQTMNLNLNPQPSNQRSSFNELQVDMNAGALQTPPQQNYLSSYQSRVRGSHNKELIIFEDDNETPIGNSTIQIDKRKFISPTTVDTMQNPLHPSINSIGIQSNPHHKKSLEIGLKATPESERITSAFNNEQITLNEHKQPFRSSFAEGRRQHNQSVSFNTLDVPKITNQSKSLDRPPQQGKAMIKDIAAALGDNFDKSMTSNEDEDYDQNNSEQSSNPEFMKQRTYRMPGLNKQKSFTTETTPQNQKILKKINEMYQNIGIPAKQSRFLQKNILFQHLHNTLMQNLEDEGALDLEEPHQCEDFENTQLNSKNRKLTNFMGQRIIPKKEMVFEFPSINTDRMKNFKAYFTNFNCSAVLERLANYKPNAYNKRNRLYHIYYRDTIKKGFHNVTSFNVTTPANSRVSNNNQMSKIADLIINSQHIKDRKKKTTIINPKPQEQQQNLNKKFSMIESKLPYLKSQMGQSQHFKIRSNTLYIEDSDDEF